jgi:hypothetical protein
VPGHAVSLARPTSFVCLLHPGQQQAKGLTPCNLWQVVQWQYLLERGLSLLNWYVTLPQWHFPFHFASKFAFASVSWTLYGGRCFHWSSSPSVVVPAWYWWLSSAPLPFWASSSVIFACLFDDFSVDAEELLRL